MQDHFFKALGMCLLALLSACAAGSTQELKITSPLGGIEARNSVPPNSDGTTAETTVIIHAGPELAGLAVKATVTDGNGAAISGPETILVPGPNTVIVPGGMGPPHLTFYVPFPTVELPSTSGPPPLPPPPNSGPRILCRFVFEQIDWLARLDRPNVSYHLELEALSLAQAQTRHEHLAGTTYAALIRGDDPGPVPDQVKAVAFTSWELVQSGPDAGKVIFTSMKPGTRVEEYRLDLNGIVGYATLANGASSWTIGEWQIVSALILAADINIPSLPGDVAANEWEIVLDTDVGEALPLRVELEIELH